MARMEAEAGGFVLLTHVPTAGDLAPRARDILPVYQDHHGTEQNDGFLKEPVLVNRLFLKQPERLAAVGLILWLALLIGRVMERAMRTYVDTTSPLLPGWDKQATERPTACRRVTTFAGVMGFKLGPDRQLACPLSVVPQPYRPALDGPATCFTLPTGEQRTTMAAQRLSRHQKRILQW